MCEHLLITVVLFISKESECELPDLQLWQCFLSHDIKSKENQSTKLLWWQK